MTSGMKAKYWDNKSCSCESSEERIKRGMKVSIFRPLRSPSKILLNISQIQMWGIKHFRDKGHELPDQNVEEGSGVAEVAKEPSQGSQGCRQRIMPHCLSVIWSVPVDMAAKGRGALWGMGSTASTKWFIAYLAGKGREENMSTFLISWLGISWQMFSSYAL